MNNVADPNVRVEEWPLIKRAAGGDRTAQHELFVRYRDAAYAVALRVTGRNEDALDAVQDSFIKAFERLAAFQGESGFKTWLLRIVTNHSLDLLRARKVRLAQPIDAGPDGDDEPRNEPVAAGAEEQIGAGLEAGELAVRLQAAIESLPPDQRAAFSLYASGEMTYGQIAEVMGIPIGTVMSRLFHARRRLQERLKDLAPKAPDESVEKPDGASRTG